MIRTFEQKMRCVLPPYSFCLLALAPVAGTFLLEVLLTRLIYREWANPFTIPEQLNPHLHQGILPFIGFCYGLWRVAAFHPCYRPKYREWLRTVAWSPQQQLPLGQPTFVWQDGIVFLTLAAMAGSWQWGLATGAAMLGGWSLLLTAANYAARLDGLAFVSALALLPIPLSQFYPWLGALTLPAYLIAAWGVKACLQLFPWESMPRWDVLRASHVERVGRPNDAWPQLQTLQYGDAVVGISLSHAMKIAALTGVAAALFSLGCELDGDARSLRHPEARIQLIVAPCLLMCGIRLLLYASVGRPPISFAGRLATGRLLVPGYDQIFIAPLLVLAIGIGAPMILWHWGASDWLTAGVTTFATLAVALGMGPNLARWQLTGEHRIATRRRVNSKWFTNSRGTA